MHIKEKNSKLSEVEMTEIVLPQHTNAFGTIFGGVLTSWVDIAGSVAAFRHANRPVVTASIDAMHFLQPIKLGWIVTIKAKLNAAWHSSCEVGVRITAENPLTGETFHTASAFVTMVALDSQNKPASMPHLVHDTQEDMRRMEEANLRRKTRLKLKEEIAQRSQDKK